MPGTELYGAEERKEINDVLETGVFFRFNHEAQRNNIWKAREMEAEVCPCRIQRLDRHSDGPRCCRNWHR
jgi:hypothetical protein